MTGVIDENIIVQKTADFYNVARYEFISTSKFKRVAIAQQVAMYLMRKMTALSMQEIAIALGGKHHTTVMFGIRKIERMLPSDQLLETQIAVIRAKVETASNCGMEIT